LRHLWSNIFQITSFIPYAKFWTMEASPRCRPLTGQELHMSALFTEVQVGRYTFANRIVMAP